MIVVRTPFRLPLGGGGTDLPAYYQQFGGFLITAAVNKYMFLSINRPALVRRMRLAYSKVENVAIGDYDAIQHDVVRETFRHFKIHCPIEITSVADIGAGTGMGSSSSYTVGLLNGLNAMMRRHLPIQELAEEACMVEMELAKKPVGKQDAYAAAFGGIIAMEIAMDGTVTVHPLNLEEETILELESRLMMFYTGIQRDANEILAEQGEKVRVSAETATAAMHRIKEIGHQSKEAMEAGDITRLGNLMHEHWTTKKSVSTKMSSPDIDRWYDLALANGALGGKVMGAGGGGFLLFCIKPGERRNLRSALEAAGLHHMDFRFDWDGSRVLVNLSDSK
jgi:D-glycero-alpha-D-manno-heptose-7-phosphate kinase